MASASISDLPNEILTHIFGFLQNADLNEARQVSAGWKGLIDEVVGMSVNLGSPNEFTFTDAAVWEDAEVVDEIGIRECLVGTLEEVIVNPFKHPKVVRSLSFEGPITFFSFLNLLCPLPALQHLQLHYSALQGVQLTSDMISTRLLKTLKISSHCITGEHTRDGAVRFTENVVICLTNIKSTRLEKCILDLPFLPEFEFEITAAILNLAACHSNSLGVLQIYFGTVFDLKPTAIGIIPTQFTQKQLEQVNNGLLNGTTLKRICYAGPKNLLQNQTWTSFFGKQQSLSELFYMNDTPKIEHGLTTIRLNTSTLTKVLFHINASGNFRTAMELDCSIFKECHNLTHLLIRGRPIIRRIVPNDLNFNGVTHQVSYPKLENVEYLPKQIRLVSFRDILLNTSDIEQLLKPGGLPELKKLRLVDTGSHGELGVTSEQLLEIYHSKRFIEVELIKSFNRLVLKSTMCFKFLDELLINHVMENWTLHLDWEEEEGDYVRKHTGMFEYNSPDHHLRANDVCDVVFK